MVLEHAGQETLREIEGGEPIGLGLVIFEPISKEEHPIKEILEVGGQGLKRRVAYSCFLPYFRYLVIQQREVGLVQHSIHGRFASDCLLQVAQLFLHTGKQFVEFVTFLLHADLKGIYVIGHILYYHLGFGDILLGRFYRCFL